MTVINKSRIEFSVITAIPTEVLILDDFELQKHDKYEQIYKSLVLNVK